MAHPRTGLDQSGIGLINDNLPNRLTGRENPDDQHIPLPPRFPDLTQLDYFVWGFTKSKVNVWDYQNLEDLKTSISIKLG